jgi:hypothetical protein
MARHTKRWLDENTAWRLAALSQIKQWVEDNSQGPYDKVTNNVVIKRFARLEQFIWALFPDAPAAPFAPEDAAALIVLPRWKALAFARRMFGAGPGIAKDLIADDLDFNMDWFWPKGWR